MKPKIGDAPAYVAADLVEVKGMEPTDNLVFKASFEYFIENPHGHIEPGELFGIDNKYGGHTR